MFHLGSSLLKALNPVTCELLMSIFNKCIQKITKTKILKTAIVIPILKSGEKDRTTDLYR